MGIEVATGTIGFQDARGLQRLYETIEEAGIATRKFYVDGPFAGVNTELQHSNDSTFDIAKSFKADIEIMSFVPEFDKRMKYLEMCRKYAIDFLLIIDTDEYLLRADGSRFLEHCDEIMKSGTDHNVFAVLQHVGEHKYGQPINFRKLVLNERPRLWYKPGDMTYVRGSHSIFKNINHDRNYWPGTHRVDMHGTMRGIWIAQDTSHRTAARQLLQHEYEEKVLIPYEQEIVRLQAMENLPGLFF
ncbi:MAG TPA: hypothetical protein VGE97_03480 [Nitrososphaera sp.]|jgi:hypothetical protein